MPFSRPSIGSPFLKSARVQYPDLDIVRQRPASGLDNEVRKSFAEEIVKKDGVGVIGWSFTQNGLNYACRIKDEQNNDVYGFGVEVQKDKPFLHRSSQMRIAEKAHVLAVIEQCLSPEKQKQHRSAFFELEKCCFNEASGVVKTGPRAIQTKLVPVGSVTGYCGLAFAGDNDFLKPAEPVVLALEWDMDGKTYSIDCSEAIPRFRIGYAANPNMSKINMTRSEAKEAVSYARTKINFTDRELAKLCGITGLWTRLDMTAEWLSMMRQPS